MERHLVEPIALCVDALRRVDAASFGEVDWDTFQSKPGVNELLLTLARQLPELGKRLANAEGVRNQTDSMYGTSAGVVYGLAVVVSLLTVVMSAYHLVSAYPPNASVPAYLRTKAGTIALVLGTLLLCGMAGELTMRLTNQSRLVNNETQKLDNLGTGIDTLRSLLGGRKCDANVDGNKVLVWIRDKYAYTSADDCKAAGEGSAHLTWKQTWNEDGAELRTTLQGLRVGIDKLDAEVRALDVMRSTQDLRRSVMYLQTFVLRAAARPRQAGGDEDAVSDEVVREALLPKFVAVPNLVPAAGLTADQTTPVANAAACVEQGGSGGFSMCAFADGQCKLYKKCRLDVRLSNPVLGEQHVVFMAAAPEVDAVVQITGTPATRESFEQGVAECKGGACGSTYISECQDHGSRRYLTPGQADRITFVDVDANKAPIVLTRPFDSFLSMATAKHMQFTLSQYGEMLAGKLVKTGLDASRPGVRANVHAVLARAYATKGYGAALVAEYDRIMDRVVELRALTKAAPTPSSALAEGHFLSLADFRARLAALSQSEYKHDFSESVRVAKLSTERMLTRYGMSSLDQRLTTHEIAVKRSACRWLATMAVVGLLYYLVSSWDDLKAQPGKVVVTLILALAGLVFVASTFFSSLDRREAYNDYNSAVMEDNGKALVVAARMAADAIDSAALGGEGAQRVQLPPEKDDEVLQLYVSVKDMVSAFQRCNSVNALGNVKVPLQISDLAVDTVFLAGLAVVAVYVVYKFDFVERVWDLRWMLRAKAKLRRYVEVPPTELAFYLEQAKIPPELLDVLKYGALVLLCIGVTLYASAAGSAAKQVKPGLFNSALYVDRKCV